MSGLRELFAHFFVDVDTDELKKGEKEIEGFKETLEKAGQAVKAFVGYEVAKEAYEFIESTVEAGAQLKAMAVRLGTTTDELQAMHLAAQEAEVSVSSMDAAMRFLNRNMAAGGKHGGEAHAQFAKLGIALKDSEGKARPAGDVMADLADAIAEIPDAAKKTQLAMQLLGRGGAELIPLLNKGHEAFDEARKGMEELGGGMTDEFVEAADKASTATTHLAFAWTGLKARIVNALIPGFIEVSKALTDIVAGVIALERKSHVIEDAFSVGKVAIVVIGLLKIKSVLDTVTRAQLMAFATNPVTLWVLGIAAALVVYNDLRTALEGGKSVFGDYFGQTGIERLNEALTATIDIADTIWTIFGALFKTISATTEMIVGAVTFLFDKKAGTEFINEAKGTFSEAFGSDWKNLGGRVASREETKDQVGERKTREWQANAASVWGSALQPNITKKNAGAYAEQWSSMLTPKVGLGSGYGLQGLPSAGPTQTNHFEFHSPVDKAAVKQGAQEGLSAANDRMRELDHSSTTAKRP